MKLHFDPNQQFQHDAINSIVDIFEGQPLNQGDFSLFNNNDQLKTNTALQMKDAGIEFKVV